MIQELLLLTTEKFTDDRFDERMDGLIEKIIADNDDVKSACGVCITYQTDHAIHKQVQAYCRKRSAGFKRMKHITTSNITQGKYCVEYTGESLFRKMLKDCGVKTHKPN